MKRAKPLKSGQKADGMENQQFPTNWALPLPFVPANNILKSTRMGERDPRTKEVRQSLKSLYEAWHKPEKAVSY